MVLTNGPTLRFVMQPDLVFTANYVANPFLGTRGVYNGLFYASDPLQRLHDRSGAFNLTVTGLGGYSGTAILAGKRTNSVSGKFDLNGFATNRVVLNPSNSYTVEWQLALTPGVDQITGRLSNGVWEVPLAGVRAWFNGTNNKATNYNGKYTMAVHAGPLSDPFTAPQGDGYATGNIDLAGNFSVAGMLADNTPFALKKPLAKDGSWPLYVSLYSGKGSIFGWVTNYADTSVDLMNDLAGDLFWIRPLITNAVYHREGFMDTFVLGGSRYQPPQPPARPTNSVLPATEYYVYYTGDRRAHV